MSERWPSYVKKKKARFLTMRPPTRPPNRLMRSGGRTFGWPRLNWFAFVMGSFAFRASSRKNSKSPPWNAFVPDFVTTFMTAPPARPNSAEKPFWFT